MTSVKELIRWLKTLNPNAQVGVAEDIVGLREVYRGVMTEAYLEIGGIPEEIEDEGEREIPQGRKATWKDLEGLEAGSEVWVEPCKKDREYYDTIHEFTGSFVKIRGEGNERVVTVCDADDFYYDLELASIRLPE